MRSTVTRDSLRLRAPYRLLRRLRHPRGRRRRRAEALAVRLLPEWLSQLVGDRPLRLLRFQTLALIVGDHRTAYRAALGTDDRVGEEDLTIALIAQWEMGEQAEAEAIAAGHANLGGDPRLRAVTRFYLYLERPEAAQQPFDQLEDLNVKLAFDLSQAWRRHGQQERAQEVIERVLARDPGNVPAELLRARIVGERRAMSWEWADGAQVPLEPQPGRVLHMVAQSLPHHRAGSTYRTHYTVRAQHARGIDASVVTRCGFPTRGSADPETVGDVIYHRLSGPADVDGEWYLDQQLEHHFAAASELIAELRPAILHPASDYMNASVAIGLGRRFDLPVVYEVRGFPEEYLRRRPGSRVRYEKWGTRRTFEAECWRRVDRIVTLAEVMKEHIASKGVDPDRITVIPNAVDADTFVPGPPDPALRARLGIAPDEVVLGYISSFAAYEGIRYLIEATARLLHQGRRVRLLLVGDGFEREHLVQLARRLRVADQTIFAGRVDHSEVGSYYDLIDVFVVPRTSEATTELVTPLKPYEAMAMEKAVVVSRTKALSEMVREGETGLTFTPEDAGDLAALIDRLIDDPEMRISLGRQARAWVRENRSWEGNAARYAELYDEVLTSRGTRPVQPSRAA